MNSFLYSSMSDSEKLAKFEEDIKTLNKTNFDLKRQLDIAKLENEKQQNLLNELQSWVENIAEIKLGKESENFCLFMQVKPIFQIL